MVVSGQLTKQEGLEVLQSSPYPSERDLDLDKEYFIKKMGWSELELSDYLRRPEVPHDHYRTEVPFANFVARLKEGLQ